VDKCVEYITEFSEVLEKERGDELKVAIANVPGLRKQIETAKQKYSQVLSAALRNDNTAQMHLQIVERRKKAEQQIMQSSKTVESTLWRMVAQAPGQLQYSYKVSDIADPIESMRVGFNLLNTNNNNNNTATSFVSKSK
jgi:hypothetical protein